MRLQATSTAKVVSGTPTTPSERFGAGLTINTRCSTSCGASTPIPNLKRIVMQTLGKYPNAKLLIEDAGSGTSLIQDLQSEAYRYTPTDPLVTRSCG
jgi:hypothetical protein